jgi:hypothetical protein
MALVRACVDMLPRLQAEEALQEATVMALGSGSMKPHHARETQARLLRTASSGRSRAGRRVATPDDLATMGIGVRRGVR